MSPVSMTCQSSVIAADILAPESGEEGAALPPAGRPLAGLGRFVLLTAPGYRLPAHLPAPREAVRRAGVCVRRVCGPMPAFPSPVKVPADRPRPRDSPEFDDCTY